MLLVLGEGLRVRLAAPAPALTPSLAVPTVDSPCLGARIAASSCLVDTSAGADTPAYMFGTSRFTKTASQLQEEAVHDCACTCVGGCVPGQLLSRQRASMSAASGSKPAAGIMHAYRLDPVCSRLCQWPCLKTPCPVAPCNTIYLQVSVWSCNLPHRYPRASRGWPEVCSGLAALQGSPSVHVGTSQPHMRANVKHAPCFLCGYIAHYRCCGTTGSALPHRKCARPPYRVGNPASLRL